MTAPVLFEGASRSLGESEKVIEMLFYQTFLKRFV